MIFSLLVISSVIVLEFLAAVLKQDLLFILVFSYSVLWTATTIVGVSGLPEGSLISYSKTN